MKIDRRFTRKKRRALLVFSQRILRGALLNGRKVYPADLLETLSFAVERLSGLYNLTNPLPRNLKDLVKDAEKEVMTVLERCADFAEKGNLSKYDIHQLGFAIVTARRGANANSPENATITDHSS